VLFCLLTAGYSNLGEWPVHLTQNGDVGFWAQAWWLAEGTLISAFTIALFGAPFILLVYVVGTLSFHVTLDYLDKRRVPQEEEAAR
jgi:hypothetical protein